MPLDQHQNTAVLFSDIENYTAMIRERERDAIEMVNRYQEILDQSVSEYLGQVMQHYGDGSLSVFNNPDDALACALSLQRLLRDSIPLRMGLHYGPVVYHQQKVFGDTVNVASRIESLGQPGTVLFSRDLLNALKNPGNFGIISMGHYQFKNVPQKMEVLALADTGLRIPKPGSLRGKLEPNKWPVKTVMAILLITTLAILGIIFSSRSPKMAMAGESVESYIPTVAVLPFTNLSSDSAQEYFADGLAQEVLILLTQDPQLKVTSRSSSFSFKEKAIDISTIAHELGVRYILDGSVRKSGDSLRISTQLIDASEDQQIWGQTWQRPASDIFSLQQEIADSVKNALSVQILADNHKRSVITTDPQAYTLYLQARHVGQQGNLKGLQTSVEMLEQALQLDSTFALAWSYLALITNRMSNIGALDPIEGHETARKYAHKALRIDTTSATAWSTLTSIAIYFDRDFSKAKSYLDNALKIDPNSLNNLKLASNLAFCLGNIEEAIQLDKKAIEIDPVNAKSYLDLGYGYFNYAQFTLAEQTTRQGLLMNPDYLGGAFLLSLILMKQERYSQAKGYALSEPYEILRLQAREIIATAADEHDSANYFLNKLIDNYAQVAPYQIAQIYSHRSHADSAFIWMNLAYEYQDGGLVHVKSDIFMKSLKSDPRWDTLISKMQYPE